MKTRRRIIVLFVALATFIAILAPTPASAYGYDYRVKRELTVMSRNIYLGASLTPALAATTEDEFNKALGGILAEFQATEYVTEEFAGRSAALADEILATQPDLIGLQEVAIWTFTTPQGPLVVDFLAILQAQLKGRGLFYEPVAVSNNADIDVPNAVRFQDRDVILVNAATVEDGLEITGSANGNYEAQVVLPTPSPDLPFVSFNRGWAYVDGEYKGRRFRFVNTHLEVFDPAVPFFGQIQEAQAAEFLAGPARKRGVVIAVGDFNSAADGSQTDTYRQLTRWWRFRDTWRVNRGDDGFTCCQLSALSNPSSILDERIDLVLLRGFAWTRSAQVVGDIPLDTDTPPFWASDHAGVVATIRIF